MALITLTSDMGVRDFYIPAMKGILYTHLPDANIVDISHQIQSFNVIEGSTILKNAYSFFPKGTIHIVDVNSNYNSQPVYCVAQFQGYYFIGADNGLLPIVLETQPERMVEIGTTTVSHFPLKDVFIPAAIDLAKGKKITELGPDIGGFTQLGLINPAVTANSICGSIMYIDSFKNAITNIHVDTFDQIRAGRRYQISFKRTETTSFICDAYGDVPEGEIVCIFGMSGYLEIAINKGTAASLLGLKVSESVLINFYD
jgi:S-adenosylmethionine hydrolase